MHVVIMSGKCDLICGSITDRINVRNLLESVDLIFLVERPKEAEAKEVDKVEKGDEKSDEPKPDGGGEKKDDGKLMPPPSVIPAKPSKAEAESAKTAPPSKPEYRPLAGMLPEKYKDVDVKELFPEFRHNKVR